MDKEFTCCCINLWKFLYGRLNFYLDLEWGVRKGCRGQLLSVYTNQWHSSPPLKEKSEKLNSTRKHDKHSHSQEIQILQTSCLGIHAVFSCKPEFTSQTHILKIFLIRTLDGNSFLHSKYLHFLKIIFQL